MNTITLFGVGKSASVLIDYLTDFARTGFCKICIVDADQLSLDKKVAKNIQNLVSKAIDIENSEERKAVIAESTVVISLLPPTLHFLIAKDCIAYKKHLFTASYIDENIKSLSADIESANILFLCEMGLDPGIDHMSAMEIIEKIKGEGGEIASFKSHCGGLISPESDTNPWHYKISWNPRNIVMAGSNGAIYKKDNAIIEEQFPDQFLNCNEISIDGIGQYAYYANRNSLPYIETYKLENCKTFIRTTLRHPDFCKAWYALIAEYNFIDDIATYTTDDILISAFIKNNLSKNIDNQLLEYNCNELNFNNLFEFLGILNSNAMLQAGTYTPADILQILIEKAFYLEDSDKDMVIMVHEFEYTINELSYYLKSTLVVKGENKVKSAMAKTVGLPLGIAAKLLLQNQLKLRGLHIPTNKEIYQPILKELLQYDIRFKEEIQITSCP